MIQFIAQIKEIKSHKSVLNDIEYSIRLISDNSDILDLGKLKGETVVKVTIEETHDY